MENVKNLVSNKFIPYLKEWIKFLESQGYCNYTKVLNSKDYGVPQSRERVFMVSILGEISFHFPKPFTLKKRLKDVLEQNVDQRFYLSEKVVNTFFARNEKNKNKGNGFKFSPTIGNNVAKTIGTHPNDRDCDNYVFVIGNTNPSGHGMNGNVFDSNGLSPTLTTNKGEGPRILEPESTDLSIKERKFGNKRVQSLVDSGKISGNKVQFLDAYNQTVSDICGTIKTTIDSSCLSFVAEPISCSFRGRNPENPSDRRAGIKLKQTLELGSNIANCITTVQKDSLVAEPNLCIKQATKKGYIEIPPGGVFDASYPESSTRRGRVQDNGKVSPTLTACGDPPCLYEGIETKIIREPSNYRIRKLTPRECFRLMGVSDEDIDKIQASGISNTQQYKMAGNSIVVDVLYHIFRKMFLEKDDENKQLSLF